VSLQQIRAVAESRRASSKREPMRAGELGRLARQVETSLHAALADVKRLRADLDQLLRP
jgi:hypothetical protein